MGSVSDRDGVGSSSVAQRLMLVAVLAVAGCTSGSGDGCSLWIGDWIGRLTYVFWPIRSSALKEPVNR